MFNRKELSERAVKVLKAHYGIFLIVCLIAAFIGSEFTETFSLLRMPVSVYKNIADNADDKEAIEEQGVTFVTSDIDNRTKSAMLNALISVFMNNEEQGKINSENIIENAKANAGEILGRTSGILSSVVNSFSSGAVVFMIVDIIYGITGSRHVVVILLLILSLFVYFVIRYMIKMSYIVISRRIFLESRTYKKVGVGKFMFLMRIKRWMHVAWVLFVKDVFTILWSLTIAGAFIKPFSYQLVPYIIAENPDLSATEAITLSRNMMNGYKWKSFCYNISFIGWSVLCFLTFGLVGVFFANPYRTAFFTEMYVEIRKLAKTENIKDIDKLNDIYLYEMASENELKIAYADIYEYMNQEDPEERFIDDISKSDIKYFIKLRKVLADWFGVILINSKEEKRFEDDKAEQIKADRCKQEILREVYPSRLFTLKEHRANFESTVYMRNYSIPSLILIFFCMSFIGWFWEVSSHVVLYHSFANRGVLHGPWLPIYGVGGLLILMLLKKFREKPVVEFLLAVLLCGVVEYFTGLVLELTHDGQKWWDYTGFFLNLNGRICAEGLLAFGIGGMAIVYFVAPFLDNYFRKIKLEIILPICAALMLIFVSDQLYTRKHPNTGEGITCMHDIDEKYMNNIC